MSWCLCLYPESLASICIDLHPRIHVHLRVWLSACPPVSQSVHACVCASCIHVSIFAHQRGAHTQELELPRDKVRVACVANCRSRVVVELVAEHKGGGGRALARARGLQQQVSKGKAGAQGGKAVGVCRYLKGVELSKGYCPPSVPGSWAQARMYCGSSGADTLAERRAFEALVVPALRRLLALVCLCVSVCIRVCACAFAHASRVCHVPPSLCARGTALCACTACTIHQVRAWHMS